MWGEEKLWKTRNRFSMLIICTSTTYVLQAKTNTSCRQAGTPRLTILSSSTFMFWAVHHPIIVTSCLSYLHVSCELETPKLTLALWHQIIHQDNLPLQAIPVFQAISYFLFFRKKLSPCILTYKRKTLTFYNFMRGKMFPKLCSHASFSSSPTSVHTYTAFTATVGIFITKNPRKIYINNGALNTVPDTDSVCPQREGAPPSKEDWCWKPPYERQKNSHELLSHIILPAYLPWFDWSYHYAAFNLFFFIFTQTTLQMGYLKLFLIVTNNNNVERFPQKNNETVKNYDRYRCHPT